MSVVHTHTEPLHGPVYICVWSSLLTAAMLRSTLSADTDCWAKLCEVPAVAAVVANFGGRLRNDACDYCWQYLESGTGSGQRFGVATGASCQRKLLLAETRWHCGLLCRKDLRHTNTSANWRHQDTGLVETPPRHGRCWNFRNGCGPEQCMSQLPVGHGVLPDLPSKACSGFSSALSAPWHCTQRPISAAAPGPVRAPTQSRACSRARTTPGPSLAPRPAAGRPCRCWRRWPRARLRRHDSTSVYVDTLHLATGSGHIIAPACSGWLLSSTC